jgi:predicted metal-dependent HD superfamily phosphohydrolase
MVGMPEAATPDLRPWWPLAVADDLRAALDAAYADPGRGYHDTRHLAEVLARLDEIGGDYDRLPVLLAAWFHDAVYDGQPDPEERSARWAEEALAGLCDPGTVAEVARLVRLTEQHRPEPGDRNGEALSDADLGILAASAGRYAEYVGQVRREYAHVPGYAFATARAAVLRDLLAKETLFHTAYARERWEAAARANVEREVAELERVVGPDDDRLEGAGGLTPGS